MELVFFLLLMAYSVRCNFSNGSNLTFPELENRIYRGYDVGIDQYSFATFLHFEGTLPSSCGGSLIMVQAILTAAHCVDELRYQRGKMHAYFGHAIPQKSTAVRRVIDFEVNPKYDESKGRSNLAVAFLQHRAPLHYLIKKIPLTFKDPRPDQYAFSAGWGKQRVDEKPPKLPDISLWRHLKATKQRIINRQDCNKFAGFKLSGSAICTVSEIGHFYKDDSGNGLVLKQPMLMLVGVLSFVSDGVSIHTSVFSFREWIINSCHKLFTRNCL